MKLPDLLRGIVVQSGNDAAIAAAEGVAGTEDNFAQIMNRHAKEIGLERSTFRNATGYSAPDQKVTARDMARLAIHLIEAYPENYKLFAEREFTWNKIRQQNRNPLLALDIGADGLKTGYLEESGYGLTGSAVQNGQRLVLVVSGLKTARDRAAESRKLLEWGFRAFEARQVFNAGETVAEAETFGGEKGRVPSSPGSRCADAAAGQQRPAGGAGDLPGPADRPGGGGPRGRPAQGHPRRAGGARHAALHRRSGARRHHDPARPRRGHGGRHRLVPQALSRITSKS